MLTANPLANEQKLSLLRRLQSVTSLPPEAKELLNRIEARNSLAGYARYIQLEDPPEEHHLLVCRTLDEVVAGTLKRVMFFLPPGSAKTTYGNVLFIPYYLGRNPQHRVITSSYGQDLATRFGGRTKAVFQSARHQRIFPNPVAKDTSAKSDWEIIAPAEFEHESEGEDGRPLKRGGYLAVGVDCGVTGNRANGGVIDDPVAGRKQADSVRIQESTWDWYRTDFLTRMLPGAWQVIIQTRWHQDDLSGRILPESWNGESGDIVARDGQVWRVVCLPAIVESEKQARTDPLGRQVGDVLWPDFYTPAIWEQARKTQSTRDWSSLYQQVPAPESGIYFEREDFRWYDPADPPKRLHKYLSSDFAVTSEQENKNADWTELLINGIDSDGNAYLALDYFSKQCKADVWIEAYVALCARHRPLKEFNEGGVIRRAIEPFLNQARHEQRNYGTIHWVPRIADKVASAASFMGRVSQGKVYLPDNEYGHRFMRHCLAFPSSSMDHTVDAAANFFLGLEEVFPPGKPKPKPRPRRRDYGTSSDGVDGAMVA